MAKNVWTVLSPLLMVSYVCGLRAVEFPIIIRWLSILYSLLLWSIYMSLLVINIMPCIPDGYMDYIVSFCVKICTTFYVVTYTMYCDKQFRKCMRKLDTVDDTLEEFGTMTDCKKLRTKSIWAVVVWLVMITLQDAVESLWWQGSYDITTSIFIAFMLNYPFQISIINDITFGCIVEYIGLKFDQVNEHFRELADENGQFIDDERKIKRAWENIASRNINRRQFPNTLSREHIAWIIIHLHLELRKISHEVDSLFGIIMTLKMVCFFVFIAQIFHEFFNALFMVQNMSIDIRNICIAVSILSAALYLFRLLLINCVCERVSAKANATIDFINKLLYTTCSVEIRETVVQLSLQIIRAPLKFCGLGFFQFGYKFLQHYFRSIITLLIILIQVNKGNYIFLNNFN